MISSRRRALVRAAIFTGSGLLAAGTLAACGSAGASSSGGSHSVMYVSPVASEPGQADIFYAMQKAGKSIGWKVSQIDANLSPDKQVEGVDTGIDENVSAIASWSLDPNTVAGAYLQARHDGIPVVGVNSPSNDVDTNVLWASSVCNPGGEQYQTAKFLAKVKPGGNVALISGPPNSTVAAIMTCLRNDLVADGMKIVASTSNDADSTQSANTIAANMLTAHPSINVFWCYNDATALGASAATISDGKKVASSADPASGIAIIGSNADADALQAIKENRLTATWDPDNIATGYAIIYQMEQLLAGKKSVPEITIPAILVDAANVNKEGNPRTRKYTLSDFPGHP